MQPQNRPSSGTAYIVTGVILAFFAPVIGPFLIGGLVNTVLNHPANNTSGRAIVNITMLGSWFLLFVIGVTLVILGIVKYNRSKRFR